jgi:hypothetical protein
MGRWRVRNRAMALMSGKRLKLRNALQGTHTKNLSWHQTTAIYRLPSEIDNALHSLSKDIHRNARIPLWFVATFHRKTDKPRLATNMS